MKIRRLLVRSRERQQFGFAVEIPKKRQAHRRAGTAGILEVAGI